MEHVAAEDILTSFTSAHEEVAITNTFLKICMDEPNVNWTFLEVFNQNQKTDVSAFFFFWDHVNYVKSWYFGFIRHLFA